MTLIKSNSKPPHNLPLPNHSKHLLLYFPNTVINTKPLLYPMYAALSITVVKPLFLSSENHFSSTNCSGSSRNKISSVSYRSCMASVRAFTETETKNTRACESLYEILKVNQNASQIEIKTAYRTLAKLYHPDTSSSSELESDGRYFIEIHNAYATLSDPVARSLYDLSLVSRRRQPLSSSFGFYPTRRWETDQCW